MRNTVADGEKRAKKQEEKVRIRNYSKPWA